MNLEIVARPDARALSEDGFDFCPGCGYGSVVLALNELVRGRPDVPAPVFLLDIGCVDFMAGHLPGPTMLGPHGRTPAIATGMKRVDPAQPVIAIQGDGGFMSIGAAESLHAALRGEPFTILVLNNGVLADTGGQMAPTTLSGQRTTSTPAGRAPSDGRPLRYLEMLATLDGVAYAERVSLKSVLGIRRMKRAIAKALEVQEAGRGLGIVEILSPCPTHWLMEPPEAWKYMAESVEAVYPPGLVKGPRTLDQTQAEERS